MSDEDMEKETSPEFELPAELQPLEELPMTEAAENALKDERSQSKPNPPPTEEEWQKWEDLAEAIGLLIVLAAVLIIGGVILYHWLTH